MTDDYFLYLKIEKNLSDNSIKAYQEDLKKLLDYLNDAAIEPENASTEVLRNFLIEIASIGIMPRTQARILSGVKSYYHYLMYRNKIENDPTELIDAPKIGLHLPEVLTLEEIDKIIATINLSKPDGQRNKAIIEVLYGSGIRVSELIDLQISNINIQEGYMLVTGKGNKQRLVPISAEAQKQIDLWMMDRNMLSITKGDEDYLFLSQRGRKLTRDMIFKIIKLQVQLSGIRKSVSPHTFRHSFATHLLENGAHLLAIQKLLGHESITTTEIYTHIDLQHLRKTILECHPFYKK